MPAGKHLFAAVDRRTLFGVALAAVAALLVVIATQPPETVPVLVAARDLAANVPIDETSVGYRNLPSGEGFVVGTRPGDLDGWVLDAPLQEGEPIVPSLLRPPARRAHPDLLSIAVDEVHAALGSITPGDLIDVYVTWPGTGIEEPRTERAAGRVYVVDTRSGTQGLGGAPTIELLLAVDDVLAPTLTAAARTGALDLVKLAP